MELCRSCSWSMKQAPKVFCPSCGNVWREAKPSKQPTKAKLGEGDKKKDSPAKAKAKADGAKRVAAKKK